MTLQKKKEHLIVREWELFQKVNNEGGRAACQDDHTTFVIMRSSQFALWPEELIDSYSEDLDEAGAQGRNLLAEKYAWMMEKTHPEQFALLREQLPRLSQEMLADIRAIVDKQLAWMRAYQQKYPLLARGNRALTSEEDTALDTSFETYLEGELKTYSSETVRRLRRFVEKLDAEEKNLAILTMEKTVKNYGFSSLDVAECALEEKCKK